VIVLRASAHFDGHWLDYFGRDAAAVWVGIGDEAGTVSWGIDFLEDGVPVVACIRRLKSLVACGGMACTQVASESSQ
jgi:hypothetical protein